MVSSVLANGLGYYVKFPATPTTQTLNYTGAALTSLTINVPAGWNLIGSISSRVPTSQVIASSLGNVVSSYFEYTTGAVQVSTTLEPGKGYWVKVAQPGTLTLQTASSSQPTPGGGLPPPSPPVLASPGDGATNQNTSLTLSWNTSSNATSYRLIVSTVSDFSSNIIVNDSTLTTISRQVNSLAFGTTYYWRVSATDSNGTSPWSSTWRFTTGTPPPTPTLATPASGAAGQSTIPI